MCKTSHPIPLPKSLRRFVRSQRGAVTIDYVPFILFGFVLVGAVVVTITVGGVQLGSSSGDRLSEVDTFELMAPARDGAASEAEAGEVVDITYDYHPSDARRFVPGCAGNTGVSCSGLGDDTNPGNAYDSHQSSGTPGGDGEDNPNQADGSGG